MMLQDREWDYCGYVFFFMGKGGLVDKFVEWLVMGILEDNFYMLYMVLVIYIWFFSVSLDFWVVFWFISLNCMFEI